jgi:excisionase family DNA binding protein
MNRSMHMKSGERVSARAGVSSAASKPQWMTIRETAEYLGVGVDFIYDACASGGLRHAKLGHRTIRLRREWIDDWVEARASETG